MQVFDTDGKHLKTWSAGPNVLIRNLSAGRDGTVFVVTSSGVLRYQGMTGRLLGELEWVFGDKREGYQDMFVAGNGDLYGVGKPSDTDFDIVILNAAGKIKQVFEASKAVGEALVLMKIAVLNTGDIFVMDKITLSGVLVPRTLNHRGTSSFHVAATPASPLRLLD